MHEDFCIVSDFPEFIKMDDRNRPHCENGPSHRWRDGWSIYHWHGQAVPAKWIEDKSSLTPKIAMSQENGNLRAAAIQIIGWPKMIDMLDAKVINQHPEGMAGGELLSVKKSKIADGATGVMKFLRAECPRNGIICFRVPDEITTAHEAQAWSAGFPANIYKLPSKRT